MLSCSLLCRLVIQGLGYLTAKGKQDSILTGEIFRHFYQHFLTDSPREVWARSSTYKRCFETEQLLLGKTFNMFARVLHKTVSVSNCHRFSEVVESIFDRVARWHLKDPPDSTSASTLNGLSEIHSRGDVPTSRHVGLRLSNAAHTDHDGTRRERCVR